MPNAVARPQDGLDCEECMSGHAQERKNLDAQIIEIAEIRKQLPLTKRGLKDRPEFSSLLTAGSSQMAVDGNDQQQQQQPPSRIYVVPREFINRLNCWCRDPARYSRPQPVSLAPMLCRHQRLLSDVIALEDQAAATMSSVDEAPSSP